MLPLRRTLVRFVVWSAGERQLWKGIPNLEVSDTTADDIRDAVGNIILIKQNSPANAELFFMK